VRGGAITRRNLLETSTAFAASTMFAQPLQAAAPAPGAITAGLIEAARREGKVSFYTAIDLQTAEKIGKAFEAKYPGIVCRVERNGAERIFQRIGQEQASRIYAVDVVGSTDTSHFLHWKRNGLLAPFLPQEVADHFQPAHVDADGTYATMCAWLCVIGYNTRLVKPAEAPKSFADLLDPRWKGKLVKAHPGYSGMMTTETFLLARDLGWAYFEKLAQQRVMQLQSASDPPKKLELGERAATGDGVDYLLVLLKEKGAPVEVVYPAEGAPLIVVPSAVFANAPNPNAARLLQSFLLGDEGQRIFVDTFALRSAHTLVKEKPGRTPFSDIKLMAADPAALEAAAEEVRARYAKLFGV
jgi:iron(III) transport system substrate-binding protein